MAVKEGHTDVVALLCEAGAKLDTAVGSNTALLVAAKLGRDECMEVAAIALYSLFAVVL